MPATAAPAKPKPKVAYLRPPLVHDHGKLFVEASYEDGEPYTSDDDLEDDA
ncbi:hypothetical protein ACFC08_28495 [Streptomyces sp. NPDC056112]|uniref:hypothetical protein n=1 Tax=Streptomyces sp. NPDC056112 TaxID=3345715 RepID=UPI0035DB595C